MAKKTYIAYNAGCNIWEIEPYDKNTDWHNKEFQGTKKDCERKVQYEKIAAAKQELIEYEIIKSEN